MRRGLLRMTTLLDRVVRTTWGLLFAAYALNCSPPRIEALDQPIHTFSFDPRQHNQSCDTLRSR